MPKYLRAPGALAVTHPMVRYLTVRPLITMVRMVVLDILLMMPKAITGCRMIGRQETLWGGGAGAGAAATAAAAAVAELAH
jgi:hypothetical protein